MPGLAGYVIRRLLLVPFTLFVVSIVVFALGRFAPSDYVELQAGQLASEETIERVREERGLNDPIYQQYARYISNFARGDFGQSTRYRGEDVEGIILPRIWISFQYNLVVVILTWLIAIPVGTWAALKRGSWLDPLAIGAFLVPASIPGVVWIALNQWFFAVELDVLPCCGWEINQPIDDASGVELGIFSKQFILPVLILTPPSIAILARYMRAQVLDVLDQDFVRTARAKGLIEFTVVTRHIARNALLPIVTLMGFELSGLIGGSIFLETLLGIPGIGQLAFESIGTQDYDTLMAIVLIGSTAFMLANLLADIAYGFVDPRIRIGGQLTQ